MRRLLIAFLLGMQCGVIAHAQLDSSPSADAKQNIDEIVVSGERSGPRMWQISKGDHVLWLLGTPGPLPKKMTWRSDDVEVAISNSQEVIAGFSIKPKINLFNALPLYLQYRRTIQLPDKQKLQGYLSPELYERFVSLRKRYTPKDDDIERRRPLFAVQELARAARDAAGLDNHVNVTATVINLANKHGVNVVRQATRFDQPKEVLKEIDRMPREAEIACFAASLTTLETDVDVVKARANAWSLGDVKTLRELQSELKLHELRVSCEDALNTSPRLKAVLTQARTSWMATALQAITANRSTVALADMEEILGSEGLLTRFRTAGYEIQGP